MKYQIIYADPPWKTGYFKQKKDGLKSRKLPYDVMSDEEIKALPVNDITEDNAILFMWCIDSRISDIEEIKNWTTFRTSIENFISDQQQK